MMASDLPPKWTRALTDPTLKTQDGGPSGGLALLQTSLPEHLQKPLHGGPVDGLGHKAPLAIKDEALGDAVHAKQFFHFLAGIQ